ncbi:MAG: NERD domain-containing protein [Anaerolineae bacterium]|jgi:hypothetical protein|nr:NERD domain-containing protein [Anaerolineae bacterium]
MRNVAASRAVSRRQITFYQIAVLLAAIGAFLALISIFFLQVVLVNTESSTYPLYSALFRILFVIGLGCGVLCLPIAVRGLTFRRENDLAKLVGNALGGYLDDRYTLIRNINRKPVSFYIDAVLVSTHGVLVFRILNQTGNFVNEADRWLMQRRDGSWAPARIDPTRELLSDMRSLQEYLARQQLPNDLPIFGVVVFVHDVALEFREPKLPVATLSNLSRVLQGNYLAQNRINEDTAKRVIQLLYNA